MNRPTKTKTAKWAPKPRPTAKAATAVLDEKARSASRMLQSFSPWDFRSWQALRQRFWNKNWPHALTPTFGEGEEAIALRCYCRRAPRRGVGLHPVGHADSGHVAWPLTAILEVEPQQPKEQTACRA
ncbi:unnamed protein product [Cuscuta europaea]|uniref:Uncharacterized protein n=1 Tax=Cuscuta europaea TaxID=41803 RepID=A0A9P0ZB85_CUSEU|nr:unnamed protein product [Cuscuta europaea]